MILGFTGTSRGMTQRQLAVVRYLFSELELIRLHHGDCVGADAQAHRLARDLEAQVYGHPPSDPKLRAFCDFDFALKPAAYLTRNRRIVEAATGGVIAAPKDFTKPTNLRGQGTWTTYGYAQQAGRRIWLVFPDGTFKEEPAK